MTQPGTYIASEKPLFVFIGRCEPCDRPVRTTTDLFGGDHYPVACPDCHTFTECERLFAVTKKMACDSRCESAYGPHCECTCGGINHAGVWSQTSEMVASYLEIYRADRERRRIAAEKASATRAARKEHIRAAAWEAWRSEHTDLIRELADTDWLAHQFPNDFLADMAAIVAREVILTEPQVLRTVAILDRRREVAARVAAEQAEQAARTANLTEVPTGRQFIEGEIIAAWTFDGDFGMVWKIKVDCGTFHVRGTLPRALETEALPQPYSGEDYQNLRRTLPGRRVKLKANLEPDGRETGQGRFKRPSNAEFVSAQEPAVI